MAQQIAGVFSTVIQNADGSFAPKFATQLQSGESFSGSITDLLDGTSIPNQKDFLPSDNAIDTIAGLTICYVYADEARITAGDWNGTTRTDYLVLWRMYTASPYATSQMPLDNMTTPELSTIQTYLALNSGYLASAISQWLINHFEVSTQQQAVTWATSRPRTATIQKLLIAMQRWQDAKAELDVL